MYRFPLKSSYRLPLSVSCIKFARDQNGRMKFRHFIFLLRKVQGNWWLFKEILCVLYNSGHESKTFWTFLEICHSCRLTCNTSICSLLINNVEHERPNDLLQLSQTLTMNYSLSSLPPVEECPRNNFLASICEYFSIIYSLLLLPLPL